MNLAKIMSSLSKRENTPQSLFNLRNSLSTSLHFCIALSCIPSPLLAGSSLCLPAPDPSASTARFLDIVLRLLAKRNK